MNRFEHVIWDWNGTLLNDLSISIDAMNKILKKRDLEPMTNSKYLSVFGFPVKDYYLKIGFDFTKDPFEKISDEFIKLYEEKCFSCDLTSGAIEVLETLYSKGITQSILTASHQEYIEKCIKFYKIEKYFIKISGLDNTHASGKVENGKKLISSLPYEPDKVVLIGDTVHDYEVSREIGCKCILVASGHHSKERLMRTNITTIDSLHEILAYV